MTTTRIANHLVPKNERLPAKTGVDVSPIEPMSKMISFVQPELFVGNNPAIKQNIQQFNPMTPERIRGEFLEKFSASIDTVNAHLASQQKFTGLRFGVHEESGYFFAVLRDAETGKVLKQYPAQAFLEIAARLQDASGLLVDVVG
jgi:uncharacterized FlaG/YvyC family protein